MKSYVAGQSCLAVSAAGLVSTVCGTARTNNDMLKQRTTESLRLRASAVHSLNEALTGAVDWGSVSFTSPCMGPDLAVSLFVRVGRVVLVGLYSTQFRH